MLAEVQLSTISSVPSISNKGIMKTDENGCTSAADMFDRVKCSDQMISISHFG